MTEQQKSLQWLSNILDILRRECSWDSVQTTHSLRYLTIEEVYELSDAIMAEDSAEQCKELGDLFMHLVFYAKIAEEEGTFSLVDVLDGICKKLISRHPHISLPDRDGILQPAVQAVAPDWEKVKMKEGRRSVFDGVPKSLPPLVKMIRMHEKAEGMGFKFPDADAAKAKADEEYREFVDALNLLHSNPSDENRQHALEELGDLLSSLTKWARYEGLNPDDALMCANDKFFRRFSFIEKSALDRGLQVSDLSLDEMQMLWNEAKAHEL